MEAIAKHDFAATAEDELSFPKGGKLKVRWELGIGAIMLFWFAIDFKVTVLNSILIYKYEAYESISY